MATWNDLNICRTILEETGAFERKILVPMHPTSQSSCCGRKALVETVRYGRFMGVEVCERCMQVEEEFLELLKKLPRDAPESKHEDVSVRPTRRSTNKVTGKIAKMLETKEEKQARKDALIKQTLEKYGQGRLFGRTEDQEETT